MPRPVKHEVAAINIRIPPDHDRDYSGLMKKISKLKIGLNVFGESHLAINYFDEKMNFGIISKYDELDLEAPWFDVEEFTEATPEEIDTIFIPAKLKPHHARFFFLLDEKLHTIAFSCYANSTSLSLNSVEKYFRGILNTKSIVDVFGVVEADIIKDHAGVKKLLSMQDLREVEITIRPPNSDDIGASLASIIEQRLHEQNADQYQEILRTSGDKRLDLNARTKALGNVAAENGVVKVKNIENGIVVPYTSDNMPMKEQDKFKDASELSMFNVLARRLFDRIGIARASGKDAIHE